MKEIKSKMSSLEQEALFNDCINNNTNLQDYLKLNNLNNEDFRYKSYPEIKISNNEFQLLEKTPKTDHQVPAISFFAGAGGFDVGFDYAGFNTLAAFEINEIFCKTLKLNFPKKDIFNADLRDKQKIYDLLKNYIGIDAPFEGVFHGGPPCQSFSIAANQRFSKDGNNFKRVGFEHSEYGNLLSDYIWYIQQFRPKVFIIENVPGLFEIDNGEQLFKELDKLANYGYSIAKPKILNVADYGVPQNRTRLFVVGSRDAKEFVFPIKNNYKTPCFHVFEKNLENIDNHEVRVHKADSLIRYMQLEYGQRDHLGRIDRLNPEQPSKTVIAGGLKGGGRSHLHPYFPRTLSARECARLQTFPDSYVFTGPSARQFTQIGNAVPPLFAYKLGIEIYKQFFNNINTKNKKQELLLEEFAEMSV